ERGIRSPRGRAGGAGVVGGAADAGTERSGAGRRTDRRSICAALRSAASRGRARGAPARRGRGDEGYAGAAARLGRDRPPAAGVVSRSGRNTRYVASGFRAGPVTTSSAFFLAVVTVRLKPNTTWSQCRSSRRSRGSWNA